MNSVNRYVNKTVLLLFLILMALFQCFAQSADDLKTADGMMQQAGIQLLVHRDYENARELYRQASVIYHRQKNPNYWMAIKGVADCYEKEQNYRKAIIYYNMLMHDDDKWQLDYACLKVGRLYKKIGNVNAAIQAFEMGTNLYKNNNSRWDSNYYNIFKELFYLYYEAGDIVNAIRIGETFTNIIRNDLPKWAVFSMDIAAMYEQTGKVSQARRLFEQVVLVYLQDIDKNSATQQFNTAVACMELGTLDYEIGNYSESIDMLNKAVSLYEKAGKDDTPQYANAKKFLSMDYAEIDKGSESIQNALEAYKVAVDNTMAIDVVSSTFGNLISVLYMNGLARQADWMIRENLSNLNDITKASIYNTLSVYFHERTDYDKAVEYSLMAIALDESPIYYHNLSLHYVEKLYYEQAAMALKKGWELVAEKLEHLFLQNREQDRMLVWNKYSTLIKSPVALLWQSDHEEIVKCAYNSLLLTKNIQLATSINFHDRVYQTNDTAITNLYEKWRNMPEEDGLYKDIELDLISKMNNFGGYADVFNCQWEQVRNALAEDELAIEFTHITRTDTKENAYFAILLCHDWNAPKVVNICIDHSIDSLAGLDVNTFYNSSEAGELIWNKVIMTAQSVGCKVKKIYFVPDGKLYTMAIENMMYEGKCLNEQYYMQRLSSTREIIALDKKKSDNKHIALFGGIDYDISTEEMEYYSYVTTDNRVFNRVWTYLPGTRKEIDEICYILERNGYEVDVHKGTSCVEETLKQYSGVSPYILHIATHGFYLPKNSKYDINGNLRDSDYDGSDMFSRCGLAFAGANNTTLGYNDIPEGVDDGILTALEISKMDLSNTSLVVLSACQTGLGDVADDGVFGLQRSFKKAGAQSILMTLWNIDDDATHQFMTFFYRALVAGQSRHKALSIAQNEIRQLCFEDKNGVIHSGKDPYYWAAFVILD